jgi:CHAT domain-containing protein
VVLAACRTASGYASPTEGALSLGRGFLAAGVSSVVSSLWDVDDETSRRFFTHFHRSFIDLGDPLLALRETQTAFLEATSPDRHPAHWALFVGLGGLDRRKIPVRTPL